MCTRWNLLLVGAAALLWAAPAAAQFVPGKDSSLPDGAIARFGSPRMRHADQVLRACWLPDQKRIATRTHHHVTLWDLATRRPLWQVAVDGGTERVLEYAVPGFLLVRCSEGICFLDESGKMRFTLKNSRSPFNCVASANGKKLCVVWRQGPTLVYDLTEKGPQEPGRELAKGVVYAPQFTADGNTLIFTRTKDVEVWDLKKFEKSRTYETGEKPTFFHSTRIRPDGGMVMAFGGDRLRLWKAGQDQEWDKFKRREQLGGGAGADFGFTRDGQSIVMAQLNGRFGRWSAATGEVLANVEMQFKAEHLQLSPDGAKLATLYKNEVGIWDTTTGKSLATRAGPPLLFSRFIAPKRILSVGEDYSLHWWDAAKGLEVKSSPKPDIKSWDQAVLSGDGRWWAEWDLNNNVLVGNLQDGKIAHTLIKKGILMPDDGINKLIGRLAFRRDGSELLIAEMDGTWHFLDPQNVKDLHDFAAAVPTRLEYSPDQRHIAAYLRENGAVAIYDAKTGQRRFVTDVIHPRGDLLGDLRFSPSGQYLAVAHAEFVAVLSTVHGRVVFRRLQEPELRVPEPTLAVTPALAQQAAVFSPDERWLILGHARSSRLHLYDLDQAWSAGYSPRTLEAHPGGVLSLDLSPDSKYLVSTGQDGTALVWDATKICPAPTKPALEEFKLPDDWWEAMRESKNDDLARLMIAMIHSPEKTVKLLDAPLQPVKAPESALLEQRIKQLSSQQFVIRESATRFLAELGELAEPALREALKKPSNVEFELRVKTLLKKLDGPEAQADRLRRLRAVEVLERIGTPAARAILTRLSGGAADSRMTAAAAESLRRLKLRTQASP